MHEIDFRNVGAGKHIASNKCPKSLLAGVTRRRIESIRKDTSPRFDLPFIMIRIYLKERFRPLWGSRGKGVEASAVFGALYDKKLCVRAGLKYFESENGCFRLAHFASVQNKVSSEELWVLR
ncbi:hypothetical protein NPIL_217901 [Nephila pilipes]|uniref:Uncharacterized protein n=1 Tax=Nephila pilipes TaxID=299642 RepID=A0A8X6PBE4_NEPPI|nr:hypothetical protein NPIL_217901 [Nephila pilipes]